VAGIYALEIGKVQGTTIEDQQLKSDVLVPHPLLSEIYSKTA